MSRKTDNTGPLAKRMAKIDQTFAGKGGKDKKEDAGEKKSGRICSIEGCQNEMERSLSKEKFDSTLKVLNLNLKDDKAPRLYICREHYKALKKKTKKDTKITRPKFEKKSGERAYNVPQNKRLD